MARVHVQNNVVKPWNTHTEAGKILELWHPWELSGAWQVLYTTNLSSIVRNIFP